MICQLQEPLGTGITLGCPKENVSHTSLSPGEIKHLIFIITSSLISSELSTGGDLRGKSKVISYWLGSKSLSSPPAWEMLP